MADLADIVGTLAGSGIGTGFQKMGADLAGGGIGTQGEPDVGGMSPSYIKGANAGYDLLDKRLKARRARDEAVARDKTLEKLQAAGMPPEMAAMAANLMDRDASNPNTGMSAAKNAQEMMLRNQAAAATDPAVANQFLRPLGHDVDLTKINGGTAYDPTVRPGEQTMVTTPDAADDNVRQAIESNSRVQRNQAAVMERDDREARRIAASDARRIADTARVNDHMVISAAQERQLADDLLNGRDFTLKDERRQSFKGVKSGKPTTVPRTVDGGLPQPKSRDEYNRLPSGTTFRAPDGSVRKKP